MSLFGTLKEKYNKWETENFMYCPICNAIKINKKSKACDNCKARLVANIKLQQENYYKIFADVNKGYKRLEPYLSRYQLLLDIMEETYNESQYVSEQVHLTPATFEEFKKDLIENHLRDTVNEMKIILIHRLDETGEISAFRAIKKLRDEILDMQIKYPQFKEYLTIDELKDIINKGEAKK